MNKLLRGLGFCLLWAWAQQGLTAELAMARSVQPFPETMAYVQQHLSEAGYRIAHIQQVDVGLRSHGYESDKYQVILFANKAEMDLLLQRYPEVVAYLPWKLTLFAEEDQTLVVGIDPATLIELFPALKTEVALKHLQKTLDGLFRGLRQLR